MLGAVQGLTEFLPVSSSGHLVVAEAIMGLQLPGVVVEVALHVATLCAVLIVYWRRVIELLRGAIARDGGSLRYGGLLVLATVPAGVLGLLFQAPLERVFGSVTMVGINFVITGTVLWTTRSAVARARRPVPTVLGAVAIGFAQAVAILPGISRSGSTVSAGIWVGVDPIRAAEFSFLMAVPVIAGAALLQLPRLAGGAEAAGAGPLTLSFVAALLSGVFAIRMLVWLLSRRVFYRFAPYCWVIGLATIAFGLLRR
ncbi:MAG: undecaprenyl-diphosphate phosphatase [Gemmatimonadetes bacterium]|nr:undecaprenyl-diphosphate phosphatase [Gemmatimonadota bacterium]